MTEDQQALVTKQLKAKTSPRIIAGMLGSDTVKGLKDNEVLIAEFAKEQGLPYTETHQGNRKYGF